MTPQEKERLQRICEIGGALTCAALLTSIAPDTLIAARCEETFWLTLALSAGSFLSAYGALDRAVAHLCGTRLEDFRPNWLLIPFLGTFISLVNYAWYFDRAIDLAFITWLSIAGGLAFLAVMSMFRLGGWLAQRAIG